VGIVSRALDCPLGECDRDHWTIFPEALESVIQALFLVKNMHDEVAEVEQNPAALGATLATNRLDSRLNHFVFDLVRDSDDVALIAPRHDQENINQWQRSRHVKSDQVGATLLIGSSSGNLEQGSGVVRSSD
jgi:hypothetical protein